MNYDENVSPDKKAERFHFTFVMPRAITLDDAEKKELLPILQATLEATFRETIKTWARETIKTCARNV